GRAQPDLLHRRAAPLASLPQERGVGAELRQRPGDLGRALRHLGLAPATAPARDRAARGRGPAAGLRRTAPVPLPPLITRARAGTPPARRRAAAARVSARATWPGWGDRWRAGPRAPNGGPRARTAAADARAPSPATPAGRPGPAARPGCWPRPCRRRPGR